ncbi:UDP-glucosyltransferase 2-like [Pieris napi]|uniref:UDP-glucosyltransferase 2-like n=1 Tax=Pieris napi TaxID=78633 RepID=UPI001FB8FCA6|nr:UDP-glucosyltransferase 2-like [Pieris napi]
MSKRVAVFALLISLAGIESARILAWFPTPSISHQIVFRPIIHELARRGHDIVFITPDPAKVNIPGLKLIDVHNVSYANWQELLIDNRVDKQQLLTQIKEFIERFTIVFDKQNEDPEVKRVVTEDRDKFDLVITEACVRVAYGLGHAFNKPVVIISSFGLVPAHYGIFGAPTHPFLYPSPGRQRLYNLTALEKINEIISFVVLDVIVRTTEDNDYKIMRKHLGEDVPSFDDLFKNIKLALVNEHPLWADNRPVGPNVKFIGGVHQTPPKELPKDLKQYLDASKNGAIYLSFGTNVKTSIIPPEVIETIIKVLSKLPYNILWKWDMDELPGKPKNIKISKWFPQADILRHPNVKLFITQGGLQSTDEAITAGVPVLGMPVIGDQWYNVEKYVHHKIGLQLDLFTLKEEPFRNAIETIIGDQSFKKNILKLRDVMRDTPLKPLDNAVWWIEHVIKHGGDHLQPPSAGMSWTEYYELNLLSVVAAILIITIIVLLIILKIVFSFVRSLFVSKVKLKKK